MSMVSLSVIPKANERMAYLRVDGYIFPRNNNRKDKSSKAQDANFSPQYPPFANISRFKIECSERPQVAVSIDCERSAEEEIDVVREKTTPEGMRDDR